MIKTGGPNRSRSRNLSRSRLLAFSPDEENENEERDAGPLSDEIVACRRPGTAVRCSSSAGAEAWRYARAVNDSFDNTAGWASTPRLIPATLAT